MDKVSLVDVAYTTYQVPDLELMERFLTDFGMMRSARTDDTLYMRGTGAGFCFNCFPDTSRGGTAPSKLHPWRTLNGRRRSPALRPSRT